MQRPGRSMIKAGQGFRQRQRPVRRKKARPPQRDRALARTESFPLPSDWRKETITPCFARLSMELRERNLLTALDQVLARTGVRERIEVIALAVEQKLVQDPKAAMAWEPIPLDLYGSPLPPGLRSSWVFILRANAVTGAERHPNSHQRVVSWRGTGDLQVRDDGPWRSQPLVSDADAPLERRWASIPVNLWHQAVVPDENWVVVSFHTVEAHELIEERPAEAGTVRKHYLPD